MIAYRCLSHNKTSEVGDSKFAPAAPQYHQTHVMLIFSRPQHGLLQLQGQVHIQNKKKNGVSGILAPASLPYKRKSTCRLFLVSHAIPICKKGENVSK